MKAIETRVSLYFGRSPIVLPSFEQVNLLRGGDLFPFSLLQASGHPTIALAVLSARKSFSPRPWNPPRTDIRYTRKKIWPESGSTTK